MSFLASVHVPTFPCWKPRVAFHLLGAVQLHACFQPGFPVFSVNAAGKFGGETAWFHPFLIWKVILPRNSAGGQSSTLSHLPSWVIALLLPSHLHQACPQIQTKSSRQRSCCFLCLILSLLGRMKEENHVTSVVPWEPRKGWHGPGEKLKLDFHWNSRILFTLSYA